ncbi:MAG: response regulator [Rubricoccaceae bacterium]|nr:response regulator [Rubricoccaceae bacterium]
MLLASTPPAPDAAPDAAPGASLTVLVADDDADMRLYVTGCLHGFGLAGLTTAEAAGGREALLVARALVPDLLISDVKMPGLDGQALCQALRADPATAGIPVLLISGETRAPPPCADGFLEKPFNATGLRAHVERLLARAT